MNLHSAAERPGTSNGDGGAAGDGRVVAVTSRMAARRLRVIAAAAALMARDGFHAVSMQTVARHAEVSVGSLYLYFDSKDDLLLAVLTEVLGAFGRDLPLAMADEADPVRRLVRGFDAYCRVLDHHRDSAVLAYRESRTLPPAGRRLVQQLEVDTARPLAQAIEQGRLAELLDLPAPPALVAHDLIVLAQAWALKHWFFAPICDIDAYITAQLTVVLRGLLLPAHRGTYHDVVEEVVQQTGGTARRRSGARRPAAGTRAPATTSGRRRASARSGSGGRGAASGTPQRRGEQGRDGNR